MSLVNSSVKTLSSFQLWNDRLSEVTKTCLDTQKKRQKTDEQVLTVTNPLFVKLTRFTEAPPFTSSVCHHPFISSSTTQQGIHQDLHTHTHTHTHTQIFQCGWRKTHSGFCFLCSQFLFSKQTWSTLNILLLWLFLFWVRMHDTLSASVNNGVKIN